MPATAGRIRMPANNRVSVSDSLKLSEIWQKSVGYDPYAPDDPSTDPLQRKQAPADERSKGLGTLAMLGGNRELSTPGACKRCHQVGHLTYQCRNSSVTADSPSELKARTYEEDSGVPTSGHMDERLAVDEEGALNPRGSSATDTSILFTRERDASHKATRERRMASDVKTASHRQSSRHSVQSSSSVNRRKLKCPRGHRHRLKKKYLILLNHPGLSDDLRQVLQRAAAKK